MNLVRRVSHLEAKSSLAVASSALSVPVDLDNPADVLAVLTEQVNTVRADRFADPIERARTLGFLAGVALRVIEARDLSDRLEAVERVLKLRQDAAKKERNGSRLR